MTILDTVISETITKVVIAIFYGTLTPPYAILLCCGTPVAEITDLRTCIYLKVFQELRTSINSTKISKCYLIKRNRILRAHMLKISVNYVSKLLHAVQHITANTILFEKNALAKYMVYLEIRE